MKRALIHRILPAFDQVSVYLAKIAQIMIVLLISVMLYEVIARRVFSSPTIWSVDIVYMVNGTLFLIGASYTLMRERHVRIDFLATRLPARLQHAINALFYACLFGPLMVMTSQSALHKAIRAFERGTLENMSTWQPVIWPFLAGIALGLMGLTLQILMQLIRHIIGIFDPDAVNLPGTDPEGEGAHS